MDIGTAKPSTEQRREIPHHLIDVADPSEEFSVAQFVEKAEKAVDQIAARGKPIFAVGGTALYIKGLTEGLFEGPSADPKLRARLREEADKLGKEALHERLTDVDPAAALRIHPNDLRRIVRALEVHELTGKPISELQTQWNRERRKYDCVFIGLRWDLADQNHRTNERVKNMIESDLVDEVRSLLADAAPLGLTARRALGYAEIIDHLQGKCSLAQAVENIKINTRQFAKAQRTWFKRFPDVEWIDLSVDDTASGVADELIRQRGPLWLR